jgi:hypothetical protein
MFRDPKHQSIVSLAVCTVRGHFTQTVLPAHIPVACAGGEHGFVNADHVSMW